MHTIVVTFIECLTLHLSTCVYSISDHKVLLCDSDICCLVRLRKCFDSKHFQIYGIQSLYAVIVSLIGVMWLIPLELLQVRVTFGGDMAIGNNITLMH